MTHDSTPALPDQPFELLAFYVHQYQVKQRTQPIYKHSNKEYFAFRVGDKLMLIELKKVGEIVKTMPKITPLPFSPKWLVGIGGLRGEVYSVIDLRTLLDIKSDTPSKEVTYLVLGQQAQGHILVIDEIIGIRDGDISQLASEQAFFNGKSEIDGQLFYRLNIDEITSDAPFINNAINNGSE